MTELQLMPHQIEALEATAENDSALYALDMGLGKTFVGSEKLHSYGLSATGRALIVCQKSKVSDWIEHMNNYYPEYGTVDLTRAANRHSDYIEAKSKTVGVINYELLFRRRGIFDLPVDVLMLDESSLIQNENAKRAKAVLKMNKKHVILLSGTVVNGKYERLWSQCQLLGWNIGKKMFWSHYVREETFEDEFGYPHKKIIGYKNVERLKRKLRAYGGVFMKTDDVMTLPEQITQVIRVPRSADYKRFQKDKIIQVGDELLVGDMQLTERLYKRLLCSHLSEDKVRAFKDLLESTTDRVIVFYNFQSEVDSLRNLTDRPVSIVNGETKDLKAYEEAEDSVTFIQYQAGAMGLNLQKANKVIYFTPPDGSSENFEQSKKRIHRIGQDRTCFYYLLICDNTVEDEILINLALKRERTDYLWA